MHQTCGERPKQVSAHRGFYLVQNLAELEALPGIGRSKLRIPAANDGTARNMNTVAKLAAMAVE